MNNSPFELFRRNLKPMMILLTALALFAFVVLPVLDTAMRQNSGSGGDGVVARFGNTDLTETRVRYFTQNHNSTVQFLIELAQETISRGGNPRVAGFDYDTQTNQVRSIGINQSPSEQGTIRTLVLASEAQKSGFELDDNTLQVWLEQFTDGMISTRDIDAKLIQSTQGRMGTPHLYEQLRSHLLANVYFSRGYAGFFMGNSPNSAPLMTPEQQWVSFLKLNRSAVISSYGVRVHDFLEKTNPTPSDAEIAAVYDEGKDRDPLDQSAEPAFHRRYSAKFEYLVANFQQFLDEEVAKLSEEELRAEYETRLKGGAFLLPEEPAVETPATEEKATEEKATEEKATEEKATEEPAVEEKADEKSAEEEEKETEKADSETSASPKEDSDESKESTDAEDEATEKQSDESEKADDEAAESGEAAESDEKADEAAPDESDQSRVDRGNATQLIALQQADDEKSEAEQDKSETEADDKKDDADKSDTEESDADADKEEADKEEADKEEADKEDANDKDADKPAEDAKDAPASDDANKDEPDDANKDEPDDANKDEPDDAKKDDAKTNDEPKDDAPKVESFEDVRQEIAETLAGPKAAERMETALADVAAKMRLYFNKKAIHESNVSIGQGGEPPVKPDLKEFATQYGLQHETIGPYTEATISERTAEGIFYEPIANSSEMGTQFGGRGPGFALMMYGFNNGQNQLPAAPVFSPVRTTSSDVSPDGTPIIKRYVSWKIEETEAYTPTLAEARDEVVMAIRMKEARVLVREAADAIAAQAAKSPDKPLEELIPEDQQENVEKGLGPFTWMNQVGQFGFTPGNVPELDTVGDDFMKAVFTTELNETSVAVNDSGRVVYVVRPTAFEPSIEELQLRFKQPIQRMFAMRIGMNDAQPVLLDYDKSIDEQAGFVSFLEDQRE